MARDRQRAKRRRAERRPGARAASDRSRDTRDTRGADRTRADEGVREPLDRDATVAGDEVVADPADRGLADDAVDSPLGEGTAAPDPLQHASAEVDQARLAESGARPPRADDRRGEIFDDELGDEDDFRAPDEVQGDAVPARRAGAVAASDPDAEARHRGRLLTFLSHCIDELRRVQWPDRRHVGQATAVVLGFVVIAGGYLGLLDALWRPLIEAIL